MGIRKRGLSSRAWILDSRSSAGKFEFDSDSNLNHNQIQISRHCGCQESKLEGPRFRVPTVLPNWLPLGHTSQNLPLIQNVIPPPFYTHDILGKFSRAATLRGEHNRRPERRLDRHSKVPLRIPLQIPKNVLNKLRTSRSSYP